MGNFFAGLGDGVFKRAHGATSEPDETVFCPSDGDQRSQMHLGWKNSSDDRSSRKVVALSGGEPFNRCTHVAFSPQGDIYVSDGYGNSRVHKYSPDGKLLLSWGNRVHPDNSTSCIIFAPTGKAGLRRGIAKITRSSFNAAANTRRQWNNMHRPCALYMDNTKKDPICTSGSSGRDWCE